MLIQLDTVGIQQNLSGEFTIDSCWSDVTSSVCEERIEPNVPLVVNSTDLYRDTKVSLRCRPALFKTLFDMVIERSMH
jgi:hypothetical protein